MGKSKGHFPKPNFLSGASLKEALHKKFYETTFIVDRASGPSGNDLTNPRGKREEFFRREREIESTNLTSGG